MPVPAIIVRYCRVHWQRNRSRFRVWSQPQIHSKNIAMLVARLHDLHQFARDADGGFNRFITRAAGQGGRVENQDGVQIGTIIKLAAALLTQRNDGETAWGLAGDDGFERRSKGSIQRIVSKVRELGGNLFEGELAG